MVAPAKPETETKIDWSTFPESDGKPMAETYPNVLQMVDLLQTLLALFVRQGRGGTTVGGKRRSYMPCAPLSRNAAHQTRIARLTPRARRGNGTAATARRRDAHPLLVYWSTRCRFWRVPTVVKMNPSSR